MHLISHVYLFYTAIIEPMSDQFVASNSDENVTYSCTVDTGYSVIWEIDSRQIHSQQQFNKLEFTVIEPKDTDHESTSSIITITSLAS